MTMSKMWFWNRTWHWTNKEIWWANLYMWWIYADKSRVGI